MIYVKAAIITALVVAAFMAIASLIALLFPLLIVAGIFLVIICILKANNTNIKIDP